MPRRRRLRKVVAPPNFSGYRPYGVGYVPSEVVELLYEEYEAIKLADYDELHHDKAAVLMGVSRPTFARIYQEARKKIAKALVETKEIKSVYGNVIMDSDWYYCTKCNARFNIPKSIKGYCCPLCASKEIENLNEKSI